MMFTDQTGLDSLPGNKLIAEKEMMKTYNRYQAVFEPHGSDTLKPPPGDWADPKLCLKRGYDSWEEHSNKAVKVESSEEASPSDQASAASVIPSPRPNPSCPRRSLSSEPTPEEFEQGTTEPTFRRFRVLFFQLVQQDRKLGLEALREEVGTLNEIIQEDSERGRREEEAADSQSP